MQFSIKDPQKNQRLDKFLSDSTGLSRSRIKKLIESGNITVNGAKADPSYKLKTEDKIEINVPEPEKSKLEAENIPLDVIYEDKDILVLNKPRGLTVHPGAGNRSGTLVNALLHHCRNLSIIGGVERPGIVHRLDKDTSGVLIVAKNDKAHQSLSKQFKDRTIEKTYLAIVKGNPKNEEGTISESIGRHPVNRKKMAVSQKGREAVTHYKVLKRSKDYSLVELKPKTGRTHQIRVHLKHIGYPIVGDPVYGGKKNSTPHLNVGNQQLLHAYKIKFTHPTTQKELEFEAPLPQDMLKLM